MPKLPSAAPHDETGPQSRDAFEAHRQMVIALFTATTILSALLAVGLVASKISALMAVAAAARETTTSRAVVSRHSITASRRSTEATGGSRISCTRAGADNRSACRGCCSVPVARR